MRRPQNIKCNVQSRDYGIIARVNLPIQVNTEEAL
jgi:hypothetical protein